MRYLIPVLLITSVWAQGTAPKSAPTAQVRVVRVQIGYICGWCGGLHYRADATTVEPLLMVRKLMDSTDKKTLPDRKEKREITRREWQTLVHSIDADKLKALPQDQTCRVPRSTRFLA